MLNCKCGLVILLIPVPHTQPLCTHKFYEPIRQVMEFVVLLYKFYNACPYTNTIGAFLCHCPQAQDGTSLCKTLVQPQWLAEGERAGKSSNQKPENFIIVESLAPELLRTYNFSPIPHLLSNFRENSKFAKIVRICNFILILMVN